LSYSEAIQFLYGLRWFGAKFGLGNTFKLAALAGNPQHRLRFIHVAGTNGKGSTCAMLESMYRAAGLRVGLFTSPHLVAFSERIQVNRQPISERDVARLVAEMRLLLERGWSAPHLGNPIGARPSPGAASANDPRACETVDSLPRSEAAAPEDGRAPAAGDDHPTFFEVVTVIALQYFAAQNCDLVIWETGLGGRLDATNIVTPMASVITNIQFDHQKWLGETLSSIASEKAGIIKSRVPVITGTDAPEALKVIEEAAHAHGAPLRVVRAAEVASPPLDTIQLPLLGQHQRMNAAVAIATLRTLAPQIPVNDDSIRAGLSRIHWPGRLQLVHSRLNDRHMILLDGAHNVGGALILAAALKEYFPLVKPALVLGILRDKDWPAMCEILAPRAAQVLLVPVHSERTAEPHGLAEACRRANPAVQVREYPSLAAALLDIANAPFITIAGSLYLIGEAMESLQLSPATATGERGLNEWSGGFQASEPARAR
jgi:dihydrofolate synthase / folylpolyglutamate synthase